MVEDAGVVAGVESCTRALLEDAGGGCFADIIMLPPASSQGAADPEIHARSVALDRGARRRSQHPMGPTRTDSGPRWASRGLGGLRARRDAAMRKAAAAAERDPATMKGADGELFSAVAVLSLKNYWENPPKNRAQSGSLPCGEVRRRTSCARG